jgi:hypothetical protein
MIRRLSSKPNNTSMDAPSKSGMGLGGLSTSIPFIRRNGSRQLVSSDEYRAEAAECVTGRVLPDGWLFFAER